MDFEPKDYYSRIEIQREIVKLAEGREVAARFGDSFGKRPDIIQFTGDINMLAQQGVTSFHCSEERWKNPLQLRPGMLKKDLRELRVGWDLVLDIDSAYFEYGAVAAELLVKAIKAKGVSAVSVKFSGNNGFHIGIPFEAFPKLIVIGDKTEDIKNYFPDGTRIIAGYLREMIKDVLASEILNRWSIEEISERTGKNFDALVDDGKFNPLKLLDIDTVLISSRHLFRMAYSLHEKSGLASLPLNPDKIAEFNKEQASPDIVKPTGFTFLDRAVCMKNEAKHLFDSAIAWDIQKRVFSEHKVDVQEYTDPEQQFPETTFPPCIKKGLLGLVDGKKRFLFALLNFLSRAGWGKENIEKVVVEWNQKNDEPLKETYLQGQLKYHTQKEVKMLPPRCRQFYKDMGICTPDTVCDRIKNPITYPRIRNAANNSLNKGKGKKRKKSTKAVKAVKALKAVQKKDKNHKDKNNNEQ